MDGLLELSELIELTTKQGGKILAITETDGLFSQHHFIDLCRENEILPIIGFFINSPVESVFLARKKRGLHALYDLVSLIHSGGGEEEIVSFLLAYENEIVVLSDDLDFLNLLIKKRTKNVYVEWTPGLFCHELQNFSKKNKIPLVASYRVRFQKKSDFYFYELLRAIEQNNSYREVFEQKLKERHCYFPSETEVERDFYSHPQALSMTWKIAIDCAIEDFSFPFVFPKFSDGNESKNQQKLWAIAIEGISFRYPKANTKLLDEIHERLRMEFSVVTHKGFTSYFLVVHKIVSLSDGITCGRGSGASSLICYLLGITHVDPIEHNLFFDRFLNLDREDPPDIDIDFPWDERDELLEKVFSLYDGHIAMVANQLFLRERMAIREVARVYGVSEREVSHVVERLHLDSGAGLNSKWKMIVSHGLKLVGCLRNLSVHCGGVVITPKKITHYGPVQKTPKGLPIIQWEKDQTEMSGLIKIDLLGNRSLAVVRDTIKKVNQLYPEKKLVYSSFQPEGDDKMDELIRSGNTMGVFYIESPGTRLFLQKMKSAQFDHGVIAGSIIRPAANQLANEFCRRLHGGKWQHVHPLVADVLEESFGLMIYQEHVNLVAMNLSGFTSQQGNELRKVLGKKHKQKKLESFKSHFFSGAVKKGVSLDVVTTLWEMIQSFAGYSFCKAHSASYCLVSFKACYLKAHFPAEFMASVISNEGGFYSKEAYLEEARRLDIEIRPPCVNESQPIDVGKQGIMRLGLYHIKTVTQKALRKIINLRNRDGGFPSISDFLLRVDISFSETKALLKAKALDCFLVSPQSNRVTLMWSIYFFYHAKKGGLSHSQKESLLRLSDLSLSDYTSDNLIQWERQFYGQCVTFSPWSVHEERASSKGLIKSTELKKYIQQEVKLFGNFVTMKKVRTKNKESMCFCTFSDQYNVFETVFFPSVYESFSDLLFEQTSYFVKGVVLSERGALQLNVSHLEMLDS
jgi:DNA-directed DNA polymerase III PolC